MYTRKIYQTYLFDWDGTLARTVEIWLEEIKRELEARGFSVDDHENARNLGNPNWPLTHGFPKEELDKANTAIELAAVARLPLAQLYDHVPEVLTSLQNAGKKIGLVSSSMRGSLELVMKRHGIMDMFDVIVSGEDVVRSKPDPEGILLALEKLGTVPETAVMIGDNYKDLAAAKNAGIDGVLFYPEAHQLLYDLDELKKHKPKMVVNDLAEILTEVVGQVTDKL